ncbi:NAD(+)--dinitrogen-reductase ADP-D-ribosyltransferase [Teredinibacter turnerae]|uniref:NAD(+)--dinitrogen-reductase ADP-D-ribosyltransferase n=1 Tax=Teredinibacter turnerae TaxID=2426 RepID=UPI000419161E|nr:NAD(+)--dinitrogen-reductase ADP-D-ribosyltransferase [Teredinibacter turnerae]
MNKHSCDTLPAYAHSALNRCNLPAIILGGITFQLHPKALRLDSMAYLHQPFFRSIAEFHNPQKRSDCFHDYMSSCFLLDNKDEAGFSDNSRVKRAKADYLRLLRGWLFNADGIEAAVLKYWVASRFGLLCQNHNGCLRDPHGRAFAQYQADFMRGLYNANALESQLDLLYSFCQYELVRRFPRRQHWHLYRGINHLTEFDVLAYGDDHEKVLLNNLNSFSASVDTAGIFGDRVLSVAVPSSKILYFPGLLPGVLQGEEEFLVLGGVYQVKHHR